MASQNDPDFMDHVLHSLKWWGPYQRVQFLMAMLPVVTCALHIMSVVFIGRQIQHECAPLDSLNISLQQDGGSRVYDVIQNTEHINLTVTYGTCNIHVKNGTHQLFTSTCTEGYLYAEPVDRSFVSEWDLTCERESLSDVSQTILAVGMMVGAFLFTAISDKYGRKPSYMVAHLLLFFVAIAIAFAPSFIVLVIFRFLLGALQQGTGLVSSVVLIEMLPKDRRALPSQVGSFVWVFGLLLLVLIGYLTKDVSWRYTELVLAGCSFYILFQWWITDESMRWLVANKKYAEAELILERAARRNRADIQEILAVFRQGHRGQMLTDLRLKPIPDVVTVSSAAGHGLTTIAEIDNYITKNGDSSAINDNNKQQPGDGLAKNETKKQPGGEMHLSAFVKNKHVMMMAGINSFIWITDSLSYYGLLLTSSSLTDNLYLGVFLSVAVEIPSALVIALLLNRIGRKPFLIVFHIAGAVTLLAASLLSNIPGTENIPGINIIILCIALVGKFSISTAFGVLWQYTPEMYPTNLRNTGLGLASLSARIGGTLAPYSRTFARHVPWGPGTVFAFLCLVVPVLITFLPETFGHEMPQTIGDLERHFQEKKKVKAKTNNSH